MDMTATRTSRLLARFAFSTALAGAAANGVDYRNLPTSPVFPGPWDHYIKAPANKSFITPAEIWRVEGNVTTPSSGAAPGVGQPPGHGSILIGTGGLVSLAFDENISGRVCFQVEAAVDEPVLLLAFSESPFFVGKRTDATNDEVWDLPLDFQPGHSTGAMCVEDDFIRGGFKFLTLYLEDKATLGTHGASGPGEAVALGTDEAQKTLRAAAEAERRRPHANPSIAISRVWVNCTSFPSQSHGRAYSGYFYSSSDLLNRIWYAGAYTLQLSTIDPRQGSALIPVNRFLDHNQSPPGSWYSNFTVSRGTTVTTDGAKRDRLVWPGDMSIAVPGIAVSTFDMLAVRNALDVIYERQYSDGRLPYAGPPLSYHDEFSDTYHLHTLLGTYDYVLYSNDSAWLQQKWPQYLRALRVSTSKVDSKNLMRVTSSYDWNRHGMGGHNLEATAILHATLKRSVELASFIHGDASPGAGGAQAAEVQSWRALQRRLELGITALYCPETGLYSDNLEERHCNGRDHIDPQDGNAWALLAGMVHEDSGAFAVSEALRRRWNKFGAPAPEFPNVMSPFSSSFELQAHCAASNHDAAVELMLLMWGYLLDGPGFTNSTLAEGFRTDGHVHYPAYPVPSRNSHAHGWSTGPTRTLMHGILGIQLLEPGGAKWMISPVLPAWLGWMRGGFAVEAGSFEVEAWRVKQETGSGRARKGIVAVATGPRGTRGHFAFGGRPGPATRFGFAGGETRAFVRWDEARVEELNMAALGWTARRDRHWFRRKLNYGHGRLVYDDGFVAPRMGERAPGLVDFEALRRGYAEPWDWTAGEAARPPSPHLADEL